MDEHSKRPIPYEAPSSPLTRTHVRLILFLLLIQVVMTAQSSYAPGFTAWVKRWWADHQEAVAHRKLVKQNEATVAQCMAYAPPPKTVAWEEDPARAAKLLAGTGYHPIAPPTSFDTEVATAVPPGAAVDMPAFAPAELRWLTQPNSALTDRLSYTSRANVGVAFMHGLKAPGDVKERLVAVLVESNEAIGGSQGPAADAGDGSPTNPLKYLFTKSQAFDAMSLPEGQDGMVSVGVPSVTELAIGDPTGSHVQFIRSDASGQPPKLTIESQNVLRVFAGQADPADASHFTISYELDGQPGTIDGWLKADGSVTLEPRVGKRVNQTWYPHAK